MKKIFTSCLLGFFMLALISTPGLTQDAKKILEKVIEAQGGRKALEGIKDSTSSGIMEIAQMGLSGTGTMYTKEPNLMRLDMDFMGMVITQSFDGESAWMTNPQSGTVDEMPEELGNIFKNSSYGNSAFLNPEKYGIKFNHKGKENFEGKDYQVLERAHSDGYIITFYVDSESYLIYKIKQRSLNEMLQEIIEETILSDYKKVNGVMTAHSVIIVRDGEEFGSITITEVTFNSGLEDSFFKMSE